MEKVTVEIEIPDGHEIVSGPDCEYSGPASDGMRALSFSIHTRPVKPLLICGEPADWPEWLRCDWIAKDENGEVYGYTAEPPKGMSSWVNRGDAWILSKYLDIDIPGPWEQSLRENPQRKK